MNDKIIFREMLSEIGTVAETKGNKLTVEEIKEFFKTASLTEEQMELVYGYLEANKITVEGHEKGETAKLFETQTKEEAQEEEGTEEKSEIQASESKIKVQGEDSKYLDMYLEELESISPASESEKKELYGQVLQDNPLAKSRLIEIYLSRVVALAKNYVNQGVALSDLIQEGNIGLMLTLDTMEEIAETRVEAALENGIVTALQNAVEEADSLVSAGKQIVNRVNYLNEGAKNLGEELGRRASVEELAKYMEMSEEEIADIIRVSDGEIVVLENEDKKERE
ncbi:RNA polymerase sigma factor region1.1 domain-containing protein [Konateibacter massiliensis]|uniref:RNA polymerase sigma factor region1.1 domain-containing protein n=1 Tax=Konateibacter massiliensis TaxID=2002841 RepID=UPI000C14CC82|nr:RNA polymerase sigma factor region1.1 domain-containing protein [Konateibacter massiliensis]